MGQPLMWPAFLGTDIQIDSDLNPWMLEVNSRAGLTTAVPSKQRVLERFTTSAFRMALLRFRSDLRSQVSNWLRERLHSGGYHPCVGSEASPQCWSAEEENDMIDLIIEVQNCGDYQLLSPVIHDVPMDTAV